MSKRRLETIDEGLARVEDEMRINYNLRHSQRSTAAKLINGFYRIKVEIGSWYKRIQEYALAERPQDRASITAEFNENGCLLSLNEPSQTEVRIFIEHLDDNNTWRVHLAPATDLDKVTSLEIDKSGNVLVSDND